MARVPILVLLGFALCCLALSVFYVRNAENRIRIRLKEEVKEEMGREIRLAVAKAMSSYASAANDNEKASLVVVAEKESSAPERLASAHEMDFYVAGAMDSPVTLSGKGLTKVIETSPEKNSKKNKSKKTSDSSDDSEVVGKTSQAAIERTLVDKGGMLLPKGKMQLEPSFSIAHFSSNRIDIQGFSILPVILFGNVSTESVKRDVFIPAVTLRRGLLKNLQGEVRVPFRYEYDRTTSNVGAESCRYDYGIGDIEMSLSRQISWERGIVPDSVASFTVKTITGGNPYGQPIGLGTGHWGFRGALVAVKSSDPAVVFGSVNYTYNMEKDVNMISNGMYYGTVKPGNSLGYSLGTAIGLSYQTAINFAFEQNVTYKSSNDGHNIKGTFLNAIDLKCGFTWAISERMSLNFSTSMGLSTDAPDYVAEVSIPYTF